MENKRFTLGESKMTLSYMIGFANTTAENCSDCERRKVGAIIVGKNGYDFACGFNHSTTNCKDNGCPRNKDGIKPGEGLDRCHAVHAEVDAIKRYTSTGSSAEGSHMHVTHQPCDACAEEIIKAGIRSVSYCEDYPNSNSLEILGKAGIVVMKVSEEDGLEETIN